MLPDPLHPAIVHFPIVLTFLLPVVALAALWRIRRGAPVRSAWIASAAAAAALTASAWLAVQTGESDEDPVESVVGEAPLERHEEAAERFLFLSGGVFLLTAAGLFRGRAGAAARFGATVAAFGLVAAGALVGHSGGELVYRYGAAEAHVPSADAAGTRIEVGTADRERSDD